MIISAEIDGFINKMNFPYDIDRLLTEIDQFANIESLINENELSDDTDRFIT
jgi:hypothetical protein